MLTKKQQEYFDKNFKDAAAFIRHFDLVNELEHLKTLKTPNEFEIKRLIELLDLEKMWKQTNFWTGL